jgi:hypothetical protein
MGGAVSANDETLRRRVCYGGRKGRAATRRLRARGIVVWGGPHVRASRVWPGYFTIMDEPAPMENGPCDDVHLPAATPEAHVPKLRRLVHALREEP